MEGNICQNVGETRWREEGRRGHRGQAQEEKLTVFLCTKDCLSSIPRNHIKTSRGRAGDMAQLMKALVLKFGEPNLIPRSHEVEGETRVSLPAL